MRCIRISTLALLSFVVCGVLLGIQPERNKMLAQETQNNGGVRVWLHGHQPFFASLVSVDGKIDVTDKSPG